MLVLGLGPSPPPPRLRGLAGPQALASLSRPSIFPSARVICVSGQQNFWVGWEPQAGAAAQVRRRSEQPQVRRSTDRGSKLEVCDSSFALRENSEKTLGKGRWERDKTEIGEAGAGPFHFGRGATKGNS